MKQTKRTLVPEGAVRPAVRRPPAPEKVTEAPGVTRDEIAKRAYDLYLLRGRRDGFDLEDWLEAEQELLQHQA